MDEPALHSEHHASILKHEHLPSLYGQIQPQSHTVFLTCIAFRLHHHDAISMKLKMMGLLLFADELLVFMKPRPPGGLLSVNVDWASLLPTSTGHMDRYLSAHWRGWATSHITAVSIVLERQKHTHWGRAVNLHKWLSYSSEVMAADINILDNEPFLGPIFIILY